MEMMKHLFFSHSTMWHFSSINYEWEKKSWSEKNPKTRVIELFWIQPISLEASFFKLKTLIENIIKAERFNFWDEK